MLRITTNADADVRQMFALAAKEIRDRGRMLDALSRTGELAKAILATSHYAELHRSIVNGVISATDAYAQAEREW